MAQEGQSVRLLEEMRRRLVDVGAERIYLFGSHARGEADEDSDVDLVVIMDTELPFFERLRQVAACFDRAWAVDLLVYTPDEFLTMREHGNAFVEMVLDEGVVLHG